MPFFFFFTFLTTAVSHIEPETATQLMTGKRICCLITLPLVISSLVSYFPTPKKGFVLPVERGILCSGARAISVCWFSGLSVNSSLRHRLYLFPQAVKRNATSYLVSFFCAYNPLALILKCRLFVVAYQSPFLCALRRRHVLILGVAYGWGFLIFIKTVIILSHLLIQTFGAIFFFFLVLSLAYSKPVILDEINNGPEFLNSDFFPFSQLMKYLLYVSKMTFFFLSLQG